MERQRLSGTEFYKLDFLRYCPFLGKDQMEIAFENLYMYSCNDKQDTIISTIYSVFSLTGPKGQDSQVHFLFCSASFLAFLVARTCCIESGGQLLPFLP
mmetsp:Transcript_7614/g.8743  ORF Transcript_7614/g.8743 Transcript_7614/m.8743 type:complete len:99 (+) Transcript_7614:861-1157(+)